MTLREYQQWTNTTAFYPPERTEYPLLGLAEEAGEVLGKYKKFIRDDTDPQKLKDDIAKELGDVMWYVAQVAETFNLDLEYICQGNVEKLESRVARGVISGSGDDR